MFVLLGSPDLNSRQRFIKFKFRRLTTRATRLIVDRRRRRRQRCASKRRFGAAAYRRSRVCFLNLPQIQLQQSVSELAESGQLGSDWTLKLIRFVGFRLAGKFRVVRSRRRRRRRSRLFVCGLKVEDTFKSERERGELKLPASKWGSLITTAAAASLFGRQMEKRGGCL